MHAPALLGAAALVLACTAAEAAPYDGRWSVTIVTQKGTCDKAYNYPVLVQNNGVTYHGQTAAQVTGHVQPNGAVTVRVALGGESATGIGQLFATSGRGTWQDNGGSCSGVWKAYKQKG
jgi:hypothetical protein